MTRCRNDMNQTLIDFLACIMENMTVKLQHYLIKTRVLCNQIGITNLRHFAFILSGIIERSEEQLESLHKALH